MLSYTKVMITIASAFVFFSKQFKADVKCALMGI